MSRVLSASDALQLGNSLFVDENYGEALNNYNTAIELEENNVEALLKRSACFHKLGKLTDSLADANAVIKLHPDAASLAKAYLRKGIACFEMEEYETAKQAFEKGQEQEPSNSTFRTWIRKCNAEMEIEETNTASDSNKPLPSATPSTSSNPTPTPTSIPPPSTTPTPVATQTNGNGVSSTPTAPSTPKVRHEWYQTATHVIVTLFVKNVKKENAQIEIKPKSLSATIKLSETNEFQWEVELCDSITPSESSFQILSTKIEVKLKKSNQARWKTLEDTGEGVKQWDSVAATPATTSTSSKKKDWDKIVNEVTKDEKNLDGEDGLSKLFKDIYGNATDEQRRAMMKSYTESGGTVLSTNWEEVGKGTVKGSPPDGMEMHTWDEVYKGK